MASLDQPLAELPPVFNWQYRCTSKRCPIGAITKIEIPITEYGQILSLCPPPKEGN